MYKISHTVFGPLHFSASHLAHLPHLIRTSTVGHKSLLTPCCWAMQKCMIAIPCIVDGSRISVFSYTMCCTQVFQRVWLTYCFKVIDSLMQDAWVSSYK